MVTVCSFYKVLISFFITTQVRSNNVVASYDNLLEGFSIPQQGGQQVVVTINPQHLAQAGVTGINQQGQQVTYHQQQPISVVPVQMGQIQGGQQVAYITAPPPQAAQAAQPGQTIQTVNGQQVSTIQPQVPQQSYLTPVKTRE